MCTHLSTNLGMIICLTGWVSFLTIFYVYSFEYKSWNDYLPHWMGKFFNHIFNAVKVVAIRDSVPYFCTLNTNDNLLIFFTGVGYSAILPYYLGVPFMNETVLNETDIIPRQWYDHEDRNMSDWVMSLWCNFTHYG